MATQGQDIKKNAARFFDVYKGDFALAGSGTSRSSFGAFAASWLPLAISLFALFHLGIWSFMLFASASQHPEDLGRIYAEKLGIPQLEQVGNALFHVFAWGHGNNVPEVMLESIYVAWAIFLLVAARKPQANKTFLDFTIGGNLAHWLGMTFMTLTMTGQSHHHYQDMLLLLASVAFLAAFWFPARQYYKAEGTLA
ncbi:hypothetical protein [Mycobacterium sp. NPDC050853]|uniref:hypothetical protein n=1 Tax=Mycobacterium sp. NPDC050853 TaxID=3155160 RepID=UPI0033EC28AB